MDKIIYNQGSLILNVNCKAKCCQMLCISNLLLHTYYSQTQPFKTANIYYLTHFLSLFLKSSPKNMCIYIQFIFRERERKRRKKRYICIERDINQLPSVRPAWGSNREPTQCPDQEQSPPPPGAWHRHSSQPNHLARAVSQFTEGQ